MRSQSDRAGGTMEGMSQRFSSVASSHRPRQCEQMPAISITGLFGEKPAARDEALSASAAVPPGAAPTAPQRSQIKDDQIVSAVVVDANHERVASLDAVNEAVLAQKIERAMDGNRGGFSTATGP